MRIRMSGALVLIALGLSACNGGGGRGGGGEGAANQLATFSGGTGERASNQLATFDQTQQRTLALIEKYRHVDATPEENIPVFGTAIYKGGTSLSIGTPLTDAYLSGNRDEFAPEQQQYEELRGIIRSADINSNITLTVDFLNNTINGRLDNFRTTLDKPISGDVFMGNGKITGSGFRSELSGLIALDGEKIRVVGDLAGGFSGSDAGAVGGAILGYVETSETVDRLEGVFVGEQQ